MADTRARIVAATNELFRRRGYNGTSLKDVTTAAEATTGSLYHFFPGGKSALGAAVLAETGRAYQELFVAVADEADGPVAAVEAFFDGAADVLEETDFIDICPIGTVAREVASVDDALRQVSDEVFRGWIEEAGGRFVAAGLDDDEADALATALVAALEGGFLLARARRDGDVLRRIGRQVARLVSAAVDEAAPAR